MLFMATGYANSAEEKTSEIPIASARTQPEKTDVSVEGIAIVTAGTFDKGFALQDPTGGIYVTDALGNTIKPGDRVRVSGKILSPSKEIWLAPTTVVVESSGTPPEPREVKTGEVGPTTEGSLIAVQGKITTKIKKDWPWGWKFNINDGSGELLVFVAKSTKIKVKGLRQGQALRISGFSGRYEEHTEILPRTQADIVVQKK
jgi:uncharacterized protein YdeI (BOF family)